MCIGTAGGRWQSQALCTRWTGHEWGEGQRKGVHTVQSLSVNVCRRQCLRDHLPMGCGSLADSHLQHPRGIQPDHACWEGDKRGKTKVVFFPCATDIQKTHTQTLSLSHTHSHSHTLTHARTRVHTHTHTPHQHAPELAPAPTTSQKRKKAKKCVCCQSFTSSLQARV